MSNLKKSILRIVRDMMEISNDPIEGIEVKLNKDDIFNQTALIIGPSGTPYFGGFYFFDIKFPENYPNKPPKVTMKTVDGKIRFNPNLYECGKVCLSILGTWSGPSWSNIMTLKTVLISIRSLMNDFPITNEPGYENTKRDSNINIDYNCYITYFNFKIAILDILKKKKKYLKYYELYEEEIKKYFEKNKVELNNNLQSYKIIYASGEIGRGIYFLSNNTKYDFIKISKSFQKLIKKPKSKKMKIDNL